MPYNLALDPVDCCDPLFLDDSVTDEIEREDSEKDLAQLLSDGILKSKLLDQIIFASTMPNAAQEGLLGNLWDFIATAFRTAIRFVGDTAKWLAKRIKSVVNFRLKQKKFRDKKFETLSSIWNGMRSEQRATANERFKTIGMEYTPSFERYQAMCQDFAVLIRSLDENVSTFVSKDISIFGEESGSGKSSPTWVTNMFEDANSREALLSFGIRFTEGNFEHNSPFKTMQAMNLGDLGYLSIDMVRIVHTAYLQNCWKNLKIIVGLKDRFERFERELNDKQREMKREVTKVDRKDVAVACKNVISSAALAGRLTSYLLAIEEAMDVRRGWLIDRAIKACGEATGE